MVRQLDQDLLNGFGTLVAFPFKGEVLGGQVSYGIPYNTATSGPDPVGVGAACYSKSGGCGYDSLNIALNSYGDTSGVLAGTQINALWNGFPDGNEYVPAVRFRTSNK